MNEGIKVGKSKRKHIRELREPFGKDFNKYIAEIVTNSDDSYKRLEQQGILSIDEIKRIEIVIKKKSKSSDYIVTVIDQAEGLSKDRIEEIFSKYGGDNAGGSEVKSRGIFGQGASDVLFNSAFNNFPATIETIKDSAPSKTIFYLNEHYDRFIKCEELNLSQNRLNQIRTSWGISANGTKVTFGVKADVIKKSKRTLIRDLENFYSFRYIFSASNRDVTLNFLGSKHSLDSSKYLFNHKNIILDNQSFSFKHNGFNVECLLNLYSKKRDSHDDTKIIVRDENYVVYANDFFKFDNNPKAINIAGDLEIKNFYEVCKYYLNNEDEASAVLSETRDGFDSKHIFYKNLYEKISPIISDAVEEHGKNIKETDITNDKKFNNALRDINKFLNEEIEEKIPGGKASGPNAPSDGIRFVRPEIHINKGKKYSIQLLINKSLIRETDKVTIIVVNERSEIDVQPNEFYYKDNNDNNDLIIKSIQIKGNDFTDKPVYVKAIVDNYEADLIVNVIENKIFYPENGLEFNSDNMRIKKNTSHMATLFVDTDLIPVDSEIYLKKNDDNLDLYSDIIIIKNSDMITNRIAMVSVKYRSKEKIGDYSIEAKFGEYTAKLLVFVRDFDNPNEGAEGLIAGFKLLPGNEYYRSYYNPSNKFIYILQDNPINKRLIPDLHMKDPNRPSILKNERHIIAEILSDEIAILLVDVMVEKGKISISESGHEEYLRNVRKKKNEIFQILINSLV